MRCWVIYEQDADSGDWGAYAPDVPGCGVAAGTRAEAARLIREALAFHLAGLLEQGESAPKASTEPWAEVVEVNAGVTSPA